ncbi:MAG: glutamate--tRNA ligase [Saprospiraceae bacterium]
MSVRVRFAPSPTGALHIGGVRTALYNYLFARKHGGTFILRIEDTDQTRYVPGAEEYIIESLKWVGLVPDEGVGFGGENGPYRQSDRKDIYRKHAHELVARGHAYYAFDTPEELETRRGAEENFTYNFRTRDSLRNSLALPESTVNQLLDAGEPFVIRLKIEPNEDIKIHDLIRGEVTFNSGELDDKVLLKADGMPTYHLANIVDDHLMGITHVIRGEEWLPSTAHHVLLYRGFGWEATMPQFAHLPLIMKPEGNGKLSKRDGAKFGMPVFPMDWTQPESQEFFPGFRGAGFLPEALINFLALLGWHPGGDQEIFSVADLIAAFDLDHIHKSGARFDYDKAKWFNQKYIQALPNDELARLIQPHAEAAGYATDLAYLEKVAGLMKERVTFLHDFTREGYYLFESPKNYDADTLAKKWSDEKRPVFQQLTSFIAGFEPFQAAELEQAVKNWMHENNQKPGDIMPLLRLALAGTMKGPAVFDMAAVLGKKETKKRLATAMKKWSKSKNKKHLVIEKLLEHCEKEDEYEFHNNKVKQVCTEFGFGNPFDVTKIDSKAQLPPSLVAKDFAILHLGEGKHKFVKGIDNLYHHFEPIKNKIEWPYKKSLLNQFNTSESNILSVANNQRILHHFLFGQDTEFDDVDIAQRPKTYFPHRTKTTLQYFFGQQTHLNLKNIQIEIDLTIEFKGTIGLFEAKNGNPDSFSVYQLYHPFLYYLSTAAQRGISKKINEVICVYVVRQTTKDGDVLKLWAYKFEKPTDMTSIKLVKSSEYKLIQQKNA